MSGLDWPPRETERTILEMDNDDEAGEVQWFGERANRTVLGSDVLPSDASPTPTDLKSRVRRLLAPLAASSAAALVAIAVGLALVGMAPDTADASGAVVTTGAEDQGRN